MSIVIHKPILCTNQINYPVTILDQDYVFYVRNVGPSNKSFGQHPVIFNDNIDGIVTLMSLLAISNKLTITSKYPIDSVLYQNLLCLPETYKKYHSQHTELLKHITVDEMILVLNLPTI